MRQFYSNKYINFEEFLRFRQNAEPGLKDSILLLDKMKVPVDLCAIQNGGQCGFYSYAVHESTLIENLKVGEKGTVVLHSTIQDSEIPSFFLKVVDFFGIQYYGKTESIPLVQYEVDLSKMADFLRPQVIKRYGKTVYFSESSTGESRLTAYNPFSSSERLFIQFSRDGYWFVDWYDVKKEYLNKMANSIHYVMERSSLKLLLK